MKLDKRLTALSCFVPKGSVVADIGTDHALLPICLIESEICRRVIATDINPGPLQAARQAVDARSLGECIDLRLGDGLTPLAEGEADVIVLAGMGSKTIIDIFTAAPSVLHKTRRLIMQPMSGGERLRLWLAGNCRRIAAERLVMDGNRLYQIIVAEPGRESATEPLLSLGPRLFENRDPLLPIYLQQVIERYRRAVTGMRAGKNHDTLEKAMLLEGKLKRIEELIKCL